MFGRSVGWAKRSVPNNGGTAANAGSQNGFETSDRAQVGGGLIECYTPPLVSGWMTSRSVVYLLHNTLWSFGL